jgi:predicted DNA binding CopG/RHH family protein
MAFEADRKTRAAYERDAMKKSSSNTIEAEAAFAAAVYRDRAALNLKAQEVLASGSRQITIRLSNNEIILAKQQAEAKGLRYQTYIKMLLHEALARNAA